MPKRIQLRRIKGWRMPPHTVKVDRSTRWGNPYQAGADGDGKPEYLVGLFREYILRPEQSILLTRAKLLLRGLNLACWCPLGQPCHADVLLELVNAEPQGEGWEDGR